ncbi:DUF302 domain-containing protein [Dyella sp. 2HG41-7]|uniref:DUF302 domain-containing protein n=1 Tax=Dyella sp. 2HG41-7 TaxID=2883239 RepID=UPI001F2513AA|nr:DUF302 domain-containing protein [Dyella sp. 2HG41-7]
MTTSHSGAGILRFNSPYPFDETVRHLQTAFAERHIKVFATIDQQAEALAVGLSMPPTTLIVFGNPKAGTPLMLANPASGIDLPLKVLVAEPAQGQVDVYINATQYVIERHDLPTALATNLAPVEALIAHVLGDATPARA